MNKTKSPILSLAVAAAVAFAATLPAMAQQQQAKAQPAAFPGTITLKNESQVKGAIRWMPQGRKYIVMQRRQDGQTLSTDVAADDVAKVEVAKPDKLDAAIKAIESGRASAAVPILEDIVKRYAMLGWDEKAAPYLAKAKLDTGDTDTAIKSCEAIIKGNPSAAYVGNLAPIYWAGLLKTGKRDKLEELLAKAVANGDQNASAAALVMRGDILMEDKQPFDALKDGYLRAVLLYERCHDVQPEALYKAAKAFEALSKNADAQKMREQLRKRYPKSEWAGKL